MHAQAMEATRTFRSGHQGALLRNCARGNRAVGRALSKNPIPIVLACHRVIESTGKLGGYSSGVEIKHRLLAMEFYSK